MQGTEHTARSGHGEHSQQLPPAPSACWGSPLRDGPLAFAGRGFDCKVTGLCKRWYLIPATLRANSQPAFRRELPRWEVTVQNGKGGCAVLPSQGCEATERPESRLLDACLILAALPLCFLTVQASWSQQLQALLLPRTIKLISYWTGRSLASGSRSFPSSLSRRVFWKLVSLLRPCSVSSSSS